jgi:PhnB protein
MTPTTITPYLDFAGRCDEALAFYQKALGAEIEMVMRFNDSPEPTPPGMLQTGFEKKVMHSSFIVRGVRLMATDGRDDKTKFEGVMLALSVPTDAEASKAFDALADGGSIMMPLVKTFWSPCFGMLTDRFGLSWMVSVPGPTN